MLRSYHAPGGPGVRVDSHAYAGYRIPPNYDSMIGKLIVHRPTRAEAIAAMKRALHEFHVSPVKTTIPLHLQIMDNPHFQRGEEQVSAADKADFLAALAQKGESVDEIRIFARELRTRSVHSIAWAVGTLARCSPHTAAASSAVKPPPKSRARPVPQK